jgi:hypothetical protein
VPLDVLSAAGVPEALLVSDSAGIRVVDDGSITTRFLAGRGVTLAVPDRRGGVVFQTSVYEPTGLHWVEALGRNVLEWADGGPDPIEWIAGPDHPPVDLITHPDAQLTLVDAVDNGGRTFVVFREYVGGPGGRAGEAPGDIVLEYLCRYDLTDGDTEVLGLIGAYESSWNEVRIGGELAVLVHQPYAGPPGTFIGVAPLSTVRSGDDDAWLPERFFDRLDYGPGADCVHGAPSCSTWASATAARDGSRLTWVEGGWDSMGAGETTPRPTVLVVVDPESGDETMRLDLGAESGAGGTAYRPRFIDDDGRTIVVSGVGPDRNVVVVAEGGAAGVLDLDRATVSLWDAGRGGPRPVTLRGDGLGIVDFGTPTSEALEILDGALGPPSRTSERFYRYAYWDDLGLAVAFDDYDFYRDDGVEHFVGWGVWGEPGAVATSGGVGIGDTYEELSTAHPGQVTLPPQHDACLPQWHVWLQDPGPGFDRSILVTFDGDPAEDGRILNLHAGATEGC